MPLSVSKDPTGASGIDVIDLDLSKTIQENIAQHIESGVDCRLWINGILIESPQDCADLDRLATLLDEVRIEFRPAGVELLIAAAISIAISAAAYFLLPKPAIPNDMGQGKDSPNNRLTAQSNVARAYQAIPDIYGTIRAYPDLIQQSIVEYIDNIKYVTEWICVGRGRYDVAQVKYAETPFADIDGASYEAFYPVGGQYPERGTTTVSDIYESFESPDVNGQEMKAPNPYPTQKDTTPRDCEFTKDSNIFTVKVPIDPRWNQLIELFPSGGKAFLIIQGGAFPIGYIVKEECECLTYTTSGGFYTFTFSKSTQYTDPSTVIQTVNLEIQPIKSEYLKTGNFTLPIECNRIRWNTVFLRGLKGAVEIKATWYKIDNAGVEIAGTRQSQNDVYSDNTLDQRFFTKTVTPSAGVGRYKVFFERITGDLGGQGADVAKLEELYSLNYYATKQFTGVTILRVTTKATEQATGGQDRKFNAIVTRHVRGFDTEACTPSRSFARAILHSFVVVANRNISQLDLPSLQLVESQATGELGYFDFSLDDKDVSLGQRMQTAANVARCIVFRDGLKWSFVREQLGAYGATVQFDYRNLSAGGDSTISYKGHLPTSYDSVELEYVDPINNKKAIIKLRINADGSVVAGTGQRAQKVQLAGCRNAAQATNRAYLEAAKIVYQRESVSDEALSDASLVNIGDIVRWVDPNDFYGDDGLQAGEVLAIDGATVTTSEPIHWSGQTSGRVIFTTGNGASTTPITISKRSDNKNGFIAASLPSGVYLADGSDIQLGSRYSVGIGLSQSDIEKAGLYVLTSKKPSSSGTIAIELAKYDARIYQYD